MNIGYCGSHRFFALNARQEALPENTDSFELTARAETDIWRRPPGVDVSTAPALLTSLHSTFSYAEVTVFADWALEWDQAGLILFIGTPPGNKASEDDEENDNDSSHEPPAYPTASPTRWIKVGLEYQDNICYASSTQATNDGADRCLAMLPPYQQRAGDLRVKFVKMRDTLWVHYEDVLVGWRKLREVTSFFTGVEPKSVTVGVYAARPASFQTAVTPWNAREVESMDRELRVEFMDLKIW